MAVTGRPSTSIVCGVDYTPGAGAAARFAVDLAARLELRLVLVHAVPPPIPQRELGMAAPTTDAAVIQELRRGGAELLREVADGLVSGQEITGEMRLGEPGVVIAAAAEESRAELLVVGSRRRGPASALVLGSVSLRLATRGPCPTVIVPERATALNGAPVVCAVDDSMESRTALAAAETLAGRLGVELLLAHAEPDEARAQHGQELLARLVFESGLGTSVQRLPIVGAPAEAIAEAAAARGAGLIVVGSRGRGALASAALGSVSSSIATRAHCPVMIVRLDAPGPAGA